MLAIGGLVFFTAFTVRKVEAALPPAGRFVDVPGALLERISHRGLSALDQPVPLLAHGQSRRSLLIQVRA